MLDERSSLHLLIQLDLTSSKNLGIDSKLNFEFPSLKIFLLQP